MNKIVLVGRLTKDPELRSTTAGFSTASFTVAVNRNFKNKDGNYDADFLPCVAFRNTATFVSRYFKKGNLICVEGRVQTRSYDAQDGSKRYITEVIADRIELMGSRRDNNESSPVNAYVDTTSSVYMDQPSPETGVDVSNDDPFKDFGSEVSLSDDDLPF